MSKLNLASMYTLMEQLTVEDHETFNNEFMQRNLHNMIPSVEKMLWKVYYETTNHRDDEEVFTYGIVYANSMEEVQKNLALSNDFREWFDGEVSIWHYEDSEDDDNECPYCDDVSIHNHLTDDFTHEQFLDLIKTKIDIEQIKVIIL